MTARGILAIASPALIISAAWIAIADPHPEIILPAETLNARLDDRLPLQREAGPGTVIVRDADLAFSEGRLAITAQADIRAPGLTGVVDLDASTGLHYEDGRFHLEGLDLGRPVLTPDETSGAFLTRGLENAIPAVVEGIEGRARTEPALDLRETRAGRLWRMFIHDVDFRPGGVAIRVDFSNAIVLGLLAGVGLICGTLALSRRRVSAD